MQNQRRFDLNNDGVIDEHIEALSSYVIAFVPNANPELALDVVASPTKLVLKS